LRLRISNLNSQIFNSLCVCLLLLAAVGERGRAERDSSQAAVPVVFAPGVVSTGKEFGLTFTRDGREAYFTRFDAERKINHIYRTTLVNGEWQAPMPVEFSRDEWRDLDASLSPDGRRLFFVSTRPKPGGTPDVPSTDMDIWVAEREGGGWRAPHRVENVNSDAKEGSPSVSRDGTLYFFSDRGSPNENSIYAARLAGGSYAAPERLPAEINSGTSDTSPFISPDGKTLLFYSTRAGGYGKGDIYVAFRKKGGWTQPLNLGLAVNTQDSEYNPSVSPDGKRLYFGRNRYIYEMPLRAVGLKELRPSLFR
jgi:Tol biopolymer transport system component